MESVQRIEPTRLDNPDEALTDLVADLFTESAVLGRALHSQSAGQLAGIVRIMNTYYTNLIEGHHTRPREIEKAIAGEYSGPMERRNLQQEAAAHVRVQAQVDQWHLSGELPPPCSAGFLKTLHREFYVGAPKDFLQIQGVGRKFEMAPGEWRSLPVHDVAVGRHEPPSSARVGEFMDYFAQTYERELNLGKTAKAVAFASAHHRLNFIHPFPDGNGRVSRLMSHAIGHRIGISAGGLWSISRGLARGLDSRGDYKKFMDHADSPRQDHLDGRGNLSQRALVEFVKWFLQVSLDQIRFMSELFEMNTLVQRLRLLVERNSNLNPAAARLLEEALIRGELDRGDFPRITGLPERSARRVFDSVAQLGLLASTTPKGPVSLRFPVEQAEILFPRLFPET